jgi:hypothetical protein
MQIFFSGDCPSMSRTTAACAQQLFIVNTESQPGEFQFVLVLLALSVPGIELAALAALGAGSFDA